MIWRWIDRHAEHTPWAPALRFEGRQVTYAALARQVQAAAAALAARGVRRGDRVGFLGSNHPAQIVLLFACARLGAMQVPLNWRLAAPEHGFILADAGVKAVVASDEFLDMARQVAPPHCAVLDFAALEACGDPAPAIGTEDDALLLVYTSGTTGRPKGAVLDQRALQVNALNSQHMHQMTAEDRVLTVLPLFHVGGLNIQTTPALHAGAEVVLHPRFDPTAFFTSCVVDRPTLSLLVPAVMQALVAHAGWDSADFDSLRAIGAGSSDVPLALIEAFHGRGVPVQQVYGATETGPIAVYQLRREALAAPGSIGRPALHSEARVVAPDGSVLPAGKDGEIQVRGPHTLRHYWNSDAPALQDGWFATGDVGHVDAEGRWWFTDRLKHVIISGGENVYPAEVERLLRSAPGVLEGAICGRRDARWGEVPVAVVVPGPGFDKTAILRHFEGQIARYKQPRDVVCVASLPRTALGKVPMSELRALAEGA